jgi:LmbE family N-acetylglucosaminyl deacetylase
MSQSPVTRREVLSLPVLLTSFAALGGGAALAGAAVGRQRVLVLGAHPDDPETGCGGTMARLADAGHDVIAAYLTRGEAGVEGRSHEEAARIRSGEAADACRILNARPLFLGQTDGATALDESRYEDARRTLEYERPDIIFSHWPIDSHRDHRVAAALGLDLWYAMGRRSLLYFYEVMTGAQTLSFAPTDYVDISAVVRRKHSACFAHVSQGLETSYEETHGRMELFRGMESGYDRAEAFVRLTQGRGELGL